MNASSAWTTSHFPDHLGSRHVAAFEDAKVGHRVSPVGVRQERLIEDVAAAARRVVEDTRIGHRVEIADELRVRHHSEDAVARPKRRVIRRALSGSDAARCAGCRLVDVERSAAIIELDDALPAPGRARLRRSKGIGAVWRDGEVLADDDQAPSRERES